MSKTKKAIPAPATPNVTWTYWITRDSIAGALSAKCTLWNVRPIRVRHRERVTWVNADETNPGHLGEFDPKEIDAWFRVHADTDREIICVETRPNATELETSQKSAARS